MNGTKGAYELQKENSRDGQWTWKDRALDWSTADPRRFHCATLINRKSIITKALRSGHADPGQSETPQ